MAVRNIRITLEYEGTNYAGWQAQKGLPTVQGAVMDAVRSLVGHEVSLTGASRTDAGVHAFGQVANFKTGSGIPLAGIVRGANSILPEDIVVKEAIEALPGFDSRRASIGKTYIYRILNREYPSAIQRRFFWFVPQRLDIMAMREASAHLLGRMDFSSFRAADSDALHSIREVTAISIDDKGEGAMEITVKGAAFLRHMIRIMAGTLVSVGKGRLRPVDVKAIIEARDRTRAPMTAPAHGLMLMKVHYGPDRI
jgi:tRNA pseudouridine38-40 synthase